MSVYSLNIDMKRKTIFIALIFISLYGYAEAQVQNLGSGGVAVSGYDVVSYFTGKMPVKGSKTYSTSYKGATYYFANPSDLETFKKAPEKYLPAYGGFCAYAMGKDGSKVEIDPETYKIKNGRLLLFYNRFFNNTLETWNENENDLYLRAEKNWAKLTKK